MTKEYSEQLEESKWKDWHKSIAFKNNLNCSDKDQIGCIKH